MKNEWRMLKVDDGSEMRTYISHPGGEGLLPGVIVLQEAFGVNGHIQTVCQEIAKLGLVAISPELYHRTAPAGFTAPYSDFASLKPHMEKLTTPGMQSDLKACARALEDISDTQRMSAIGFCLGGKVAYLANATLPLRGAVSYYGGGIPTLGVKATDISGPMLLIWGGADGHIDKKQRDQVSQGLRDAGKDFVEVEFSKAGHGFSCDERPSYEPVSTRQAWALSVQFINDIYLPKAK